MGKYEPLGQFLRKQKRDRIVMTFKDIERIINAKLPASKKNRAFWSNNPDNNVMTRVWIDAGFETEDVKAQSGSLVFHRKKAKRRIGVGGQSDWDSLYGCMKGMATFSPGYDATSGVYSEAEWSAIEREWSENWDRIMQP